MLCQFQFKNFASYRDEVVFDMRAADIEEFRDSLIPPPGDNFPPLLPVAVVFGPNGGGKSNALNALAYLISQVIRPIATSTDYRNRFGMYLQHYEPFLLDDSSKSAPTEFTLIFRAGLGQYQYHLSLLEETVVAEALSYIKTPCRRRRSTLLFERTGDLIQVGPTLKKANVQNVSSGIPYLSFLSINYAFPEIQDVIGWFKRCCIINFGIPDRDHRFYSFLNDAEVKAQLLAMFADVDIPISDYEIREEESGSGEKRQRLTTTHLVHQRPFKLDISSESEGTLKLLSVLPGVITSLMEGGFLLVDELDAKLHPQLLRYLVELYIDPVTNPRHAQLVFTCNDISIMKNDLLRRDEIWFAARDEEGSSDLWSLYDIRDLKGNPVKTTAAYDRQYLAGRYGADPDLEKRTRRGGEEDG